MENLKTFGNAVIRKRGRPVGKRRMPLSKEERKARNAHYEKERRNEIAEATCLLAEAAGYDQSVSIPNLLTSVIDLFERSAKRQPSDSIKIIKQKNEGMEKETTTPGSMVVDELTQFLSKRNIDFQDESDDNVDPCEMHNRGVKRKSSNVHRKRNTTKQCLEQNTLVKKTEFDVDIEDVLR